MRIAVAQLDFTVGDFEANVNLIKDAYEKAEESGARILVCPELAVCGYPPHDLVGRAEMFERNESAIDALSKLTANSKCALAVGQVKENREPSGRRALNQVTVLERGKRVFEQAKTLLPTYDVFDEARYFEPAAEVKVWECDGKKIIFAICEDLWARDEGLGRNLYGKDPENQYKKLSPDLVISLSASPYEIGKQENRESLHAGVSKRLGAPILYVNQVGANDEILFDGGSFLVSGKGEFSGRLKFFESLIGVAEWDGDSLAWVEGEKEDSFDSIDVLSRGLVVGIQDYFRKTGFKKALIGLSGGIDSAVVACLASRALGSENVFGIAMPAQYSSIHSIEDAEALAKNLGIAFRVRPIKFLFSTYRQELNDVAGELSELAQENLQSRIRGTTLMTLSNHFGALVLMTGNKSELATGYATLYGDMVGAIGPIGDLVKTRVYALARHINDNWGAPIPARSIEKPPSAELKPDQVDEDLLPPYDKLDAMIEAYVEKGLSLGDVESQFIKKDGALKKAFQMIESAEYKRRQAPPVLKVTRKAFGIGRRIPVAKRWN